MSAARIIYSMGVCYRKLATRRQEIVKTIKYGESKNGIVLNARCRKKRREKIVSLRLMSA